MAPSGVLSLVLLLLTSSLVSADSERNKNKGISGAPSSEKCGSKQPSSNSKLAYEYTVRFWPRFMTYLQWTPTELTDPPPNNQLNGPEEPMGPEFKAIVAINVDTLYVGASIDLTTEPIVLTLTAYQFVYSMILVNGFGTVMPTSLEAVPSGAVYAFCGPNYDGPLPSGVLRVNVDVSTFLIGIRADKFYTNDGGQTYVDVQSDADNFRKSLLLAPLSQWVTDPASGPSVILPLSVYSTSVKTVTDTLARLRPKTFMESLQVVTSDSSTEPLSRQDRALIRKFNRAFEASESAPSEEESVSSMFQLSQGVREAASDIISNWKAQTTWSNWVHFSNLGNWGTCFLDRASGNEFIQYGNVRQEAYYAHAFDDKNSNTLTGVGSGRYSLSFTADELPEFERFWSITAYTFEEVELIPNAASKYAVASYTPNLLYEEDGSLTIYISVLRPDDERLWPNWLPVDIAPFSVMMRVYGPQGAAEKGTYVPPPIEPNSN